VLPAAPPKLKRENAMIVQSGEIDDEVTLTPMLAESVPVRQENVIFEESDLPATNDLPATIDETRVMDQDATAYLSDFLSRPVKIHEMQWLEGDDFATSPTLFYPWQLYFSNTYIKRKLENYSRLNCTLKLTFRFNASPFYYGLMRVAYDPMNTGRLDPLSLEDKIPISQAPGVWIEPHKESSVELTLPFLWPHNWLDISNTNEFHHMGRLMYEIFAPLRSANGVTGAGINISTYAQAENVTIAGPTLALALQSGLISGPATAVANFARSLSNVPRIGPFARAVDVGARAVGTIASLFGYSNPPVTSDVMPMQPKSFHAFANVETRVPLDKLSIDPQNETTIDNSVAGGDSQDPLVISDIVQKVSYFGQTDWTDADSEGTKLFSWAATPCLTNVATSGITVFWRMPACAWVASLFRYWHGSTVYHIKVVKSKFHKGRLLVCWDPTQNIPTSGSETALFTKIIDLSSDQDEFDFVVPYKATQPWLRTNNKGDGFSVRGNFTTDVSTTNGCVAVFVQNRLTGPAALPTVTVMVSVSAGPDMQFAVPLTNQVNASVMAVQSGTIDEEKHEVSDKLNLITVGETLASLRPLLHRTSLGYSQPLGSQEVTQGTYVAGGLITSVNLYPRLPPPLGYDATAGISWARKFLTTGSYPFNYSPNHPINWILLPFVGYRGSTNVHANLIGSNDTATQIASFSISRTHENHIVSQLNQNRNRFTTTTPTWKASTISRQASLLGTNHTWKTWGHGGMSLTNQATQSAVSVNVPMYSQWKFQPAWPPYRDFVPVQADRAAGNRSYDNVRVECVFNKHDNADITTSWPVLDTYWSAGVDFQPVYWIGIPKVATIALPAADDNFTPSPTT
jgi:hypothetical protein